MGLFATLLNASHNPTPATTHSEEVDGATTTRSATKIPRPKPSSSEELPTVIQLFTNYPIRVDAVDTAAVAAAELVDSNSNKSKQQQHQPKKEASYRSYLQQAQRQASSFAPLSYAAVHCRSTASGTENTTMTPHGGGNKIKDVSTNAQIQTPDLGIWNCRVASNSTMADAMLPLATATCQSNRVLLFCLVVDLTHPETVEPTITTLQQALVRYLIQHSFSSPTEHKQPLETTAMTSLYQLKTVQFGLAEKDQKSSERLLQSSATSDEEGDRQVQIAMQICAVMPSSTTDSNSSETNDYRIQQQFQLVTYHLRKYAAAVNASLVFVESNATDNDITQENSSINHENSAATATSAAVAADPYDAKTTNTATREQQQQYQQPTVTTEELPIIWKALSSGKPVWKYDSVEAMLVEAGGESSSAIRANSPPSLDEDVVTDEENEGSSITASATTSGYSLIYGPDNHNPELIETVLLRHAVYPGHWDAATDSIWKIFSPPAAAIPSSSVAKPTNDGGSSSVANGNDNGDQAWLKELRDSVAPSDSSSNNNNPLQTPPAKSVSSSHNTNNAGTTTKPDTATKTPNDAAVSSFFEGLLK